MLNEYRFKKLNDEENEMINSFQKSLPDKPVDIIGLSKAFGCEVVDKTLPLGISGAIIKNGDKYIIYTNKIEPESRKRFTCAHELAHFLLHKDFMGDGIKDNIMFRSSLTNQQETEANKIAADILIPEEVLNNVISERRFKGINELADAFGVSRSALLVRMGIPEYPGYNKVTDK